ncbi:transporter [Lithospermum erythrorhizon]|uniref:Transporter n=1 Tax=Lithospermum erythrorhizon TaxID=34254 RepID=A0AAV3NTV1_LITER
MVSGFITDAIGTHYVFGAFVFGLIIPNGQLGLTLLERCLAIRGLGTWSVPALIIILSCFGKVAETLHVALYYKIPFNEGLTLGLLMNTKGLVEMIVLNVGKDQKILDDKSFSIMVIVEVTSQLENLPHTKQELSKAQTLMINLKCWFASILQEISQQSSTLLKHPSLLKSPLFVIMSSILLSSPVGHLQCLSFTTQGNQAVK